jgi:membrane protease YdiL (CAAX protease family)
MSACSAERVAWSGVIQYILLTFGISWGLWLSLRATGVPFTIRAAIGMFGPALGAVLVRLVRREGFADAALRLTPKDRPGTGRMFLAAYITVPLLIFTGVGIALLTTYQHWDLAAFLQNQALAIASAAATRGKSLPLGLSAQQVALISTVGGVALAFTLAIPFNMIFTFGEEFGWRGYLLPRLSPLGGVAAAVITGAIWGLWHAPLILLDGYNYPGHPVSGVGMMVVFTTALGVVFAWLRFRSGSVWPPTLAHAALNAQAGLGFVFLSPGDPLIRPPVGILGLIPIIALALWLAATKRVTPDASRQTK